jgi:hypothetical protein
MTQLTINEVLVLEKAIRERLNELKALRSEVSSKTTYFGHESKAIEPQYDVKAVDKKMTDLEKFLLKANAAIKKSNAITSIEIEYDTEKLLDPIQ